MTDIQALKREWMNRDTDCLRSLANTAPWGCPPPIEQQLFFQSERLKDLVRLVFILADEVDALKKQSVQPEPEAVPKPVASD